MEIFKMPKGNVRFAMGSEDKLPIDAEEVKLFMVSGNPIVYVVPVSESLKSGYKSIESIISDFDLKID